MGKKKAPPWRKKIQTATQISYSLRILTTQFPSAPAPNAQWKIGGSYLSPRGHVKLNIDASFDHDLLRDTAGVVLRDDKEKIIVGGN